MEYDCVLLALLDKKGARIFIFLSVLIFFTALPMLVQNKAEQLYWH